MRNVSLPAAREPRAMAAANSVLEKVRRFMLESVYFLSLAAGWRSRQRNTPAARIHFFLCLHV